MVLRVLTKPGKKRTIPLKKDYSEKANPSKDGDAKPAAHFLGWRSYRTAQAVSFIYIGERCLLVAAKQVV